MSLNRRHTSKRLLVHWLVLLSLLLGQFALGTSTWLAAERGDTDVRMPVCTSTGITYLISTPEGVTQDDKTDNRLATGTCTLCTVSPHQLRFGLQDTLLPRPMQAGEIPRHQIAQLVGATFVLDPNASPRAPPLG